MVNKTSPKEIHDHFSIAASFSPALTEAIKHVGPIPLLGKPNDGLAIFIARSIVRQQLSGIAATRIWSRLEEAARSAEEPLLEFLRLENVASLRRCGVSNFKALALIDLRRAAAEGLLLEDAVGAVEHDERSKLLTSIRGVGQWTCDMVSIFYFVNQDIWPLGDVSVQKTFKRLIGRRSPRLASNRFSPYRSYLALCMWRLVDGGRK